MTEALGPDRPVTTARRRRVRFDADPVLSALGVAGLAVAGLCLVAVAVRGRFIPPEGKMLDAATFNFGVALYTLTVALLLPLAGYSPKAERRWRWAFCVFVVYGFAIESIQSFRGLDPRFTDAGGGVDDVLGAVFGLTALLNTVLFVLLGLRFFRPGVMDDQPVLRLGIRYGAVAVWLSFSVGILMSVIAGREIGDDGNLLLSHGLGVHGIQTLPLLALAVTRWVPPERQTAWVHAAGIGWLTACTVAALQALLGYPPFEASVFTAVLVAGLVVWIAVVGYAVVSWRRAVAAG